MVYYGIGNNDILFKRQNSGYHVYDTYSGLKIY